MRKGQTKIEKPKDEVEMKKEKKQINEAEPEEPK